MTYTHHHRAKLTHTARTHTGTRILETCTCGAHRMVLINGLNREASTWISL